METCAPHYTIWGINVRMQGRKANDKAGAKTARNGREERLQAKAEHAELCSVTCGRSCRDDTGAWKYSVSFWRNLAIIVILKR